LASAAANTAPNAFHAEIVAEPGAVGRLHVVRDLAPGGDLVRLKQFFLRAEQGEGRADIHHVGRARLALQAPDGLQFLRRAGVGVRAVELYAVQLLESVDCRAPVGPVARQSDDVDLALFFRRRDQRLWQRGARRAGGARGSPPGGGRKTRAGGAEAGAKHGAATEWHGGLQHDWTISVGAFDATKTTGRER
jgi:hypothetical protein